jgi:hypothetical protein
MQHLGTPIRALAACIRRGTPPEDRLLRQVSWLTGLNPDPVFPALVRQ